MGAKYLIRIDDVCPTMNWNVWEQIEDVLAREDIKPIVSVVPDNRDPKLKVDVARTDFWDRVRNWSANGWTVAMHGYQHRYVTRERGLIGLNPYSEFAGLPIREQEYKVKRALEVFRRERVQPQVWVAPAHSMDAATIEALSQSGIRQISDGFAILPHKGPFGTFWIPQQLWRFRSMPFGVWTVCFHPNDWSAKHLERFRRDVAKYRNRIVALPEIIHAYERRERRRVEDTVETYCLMAMRCRMMLNFWIERRRRAPAGPGQTPLARSSHSV